MTEPAFTGIADAFQAGMAYLPKGIGDAFGLTEFHHPPKEAGMAYLPKGIGDSFEGHISLRKVLGGRNGLPAERHW